MNAKVNKRIVFAISMVMLLVLSACGTLQIDTEPATLVIEPEQTATQIIQPNPTQAIDEADAATTEPVASEVVVEATTEPLAPVGYSSDENGISFSYPTGWAMEEEANAFVFRNGPIMLRVGYRMPGDTVDIWGRSGMPGGDVVLMEGTVPFLGQSLAQYRLFYEGDLLILISFGGEPGAIVQSGAMEFAIILDNPETDYQTLGIPEEVLIEAEMILASFEVGSTQAGPFGEIQTYMNPEYGFALSYPASWSLDDVNNEDFVGPRSRSVQLSQGTVKLVIGYRRTGEDVAIGASGTPGGEFDIRGTVHVAGQDADRYVIVFKGKDKFVMFGQPGTLISAGSLEFAPWLDDFAMNYDDAELSQSIQDEADMILSSLVTIEVESEIPEDFVKYDYTGWLPYTNETLGYSLMYPGETDIMGENRDDSVEFVGPIVGTDHWPWFWVHHFDSEFFNPAPETDVRHWIADSNISYKSAAQEMTIGGLPAVHLHVEQSPQAYGMDEYYVINGNQLYKITILHAAGLQDWTLYDQFLHSITFEPG